MAIPSRGRRLSRTPTLLLGAALLLAATAGGARGDHGQKKPAACHAAPPPPVVTSTPAPAAACPKVPGAPEAPGHAKAPGGAEKEWSYDDLNSWPASCAENTQSPMPLRHTTSDIIKRGTVSSLLAPSDSLFLRATPSHSASVALLCQGGCGVAEVGGKTHSIKSIHWHTPSEHTIDGKRMAAELHNVSVAADGKIAVVPALFNPGKKN